MKPNLTLNDWHAIDRALCVAAEAYARDAELCQSDGHPQIAAEFRDQEKHVRKLMDLVGEHKWDWIEQ